MLKFLDGPAANETLACCRAPLLLRVVRGRDGKWDALDQLDDQPQKGESIFVYGRASEPVLVHILTGNRGRRGSGWYQMADYRYLADDQPAEDEARDTDKWRAWCQKVGPSLKPRAVES
jgi:hypothetical protein